MSRHRTAIGIIPNPDGSYTAMTWTRRRTLNSMWAARRWFARQMGCGR